MCTDSNALILSAVPAISYTFAAVAAVAAVVDKLTWARCLCYSLYMICNNCFFFFLLLLVCFNLISRVSFFFAACLAKLNARQ